MEEEKKIKKQKPKKRIRDKPIKIFVTEKELETIDKKAEKLEMNRSEYIRETALKKEIIINEIKHLEEFGNLNYELNKIGVNLHQLMKKINIGNDTEDDFKNLLKNQEQLRLILDNVFEISEKVKKWQQ
jgi:hypothetical protein